MGQLSYRVLSQDIDLQEFTCNNATIDNMLRDGYFCTLLKQGVCNEIIVHNIVVGYFFYTYTVISYDKKDDESFGSSLMDFHFPAIHIKFIAIHQKYQGKKIATHVLRLFIRNICATNERVPLRFIVIDALKTLQHFYSSLGFQPIDDDDIKDASSTIRMFFDLLNDSERSRLNEYTENLS